MRLASLVRDLLHRAQRRRSAGVTHRSAYRTLGCGYESLEERAMMAVTATTAYSITNDWGSGFQAQLQINNQQASAVNGWQLAFDYAPNITSIWDAQIVSHVGSHYVIKGASYDSNLGGNSSLTFGFVANGASSNQPANYALNGVALGGSGASLPSLTVGDVSMAEGNSAQTNMVFTVALSAASAQTVSVQYATANGTATAGSDYVGASGTLTFAPGQTSKTISVAINGDTTIEPDENFTLTLSNAVNATLGRTSATGTITNDDKQATSGNFAFQVLTDWGSGFTGQISISNTSAAAVNNWQLAFDFAGQITSIWDATIVSHSGNHYVVQNAGWNSSIAAGGTASFGFNGSPGNVTVTPTNYVLNGTTDTGSTSGTGTGSSGGSTSGGSTGSGSSTGSTAGVVGTPATAATAAWATQYYAPYVDVTLYPTYSLTSAMQNGGVKYFTLAFITADSKNQPAWGGYDQYEVSGGSFDMALRQQVTQVRAAGGDVMASFGGAAGQELAQVITNVTQLTAAYQTVVSSYNLTKLDFDIEGAAVADHASIDRRSQALAALQQTAAAQGHTLDVWFTLPVLPTGLTADGLYVLQSALKYGVKIGGVNIMTMDYGDSAAPNPAGHMGDYTIQAANSLYGQLQGLYGTSLSASQLWNMVGLTPMIGVNDVTTEVFNQAAAQQVVAFAQQHGISRISMWSLNRDTTSTAKNYPDTITSSINQQAWDFSHIFETI
ncbi:MAG TPA: cellulose binding domain-containing protein [Pirellulales bacterium]|nr:cellulose binding domain-containing protein [Pirellulales bacterium]